MKKLTLAALAISLTSASAFAVANTIELKSNSSSHLTWAWDSNDKNAVIKTQVSSQQMSWAWDSNEKVVLSKVAPAQYISWAFE